MERRYDSFPEGSLLLERGTLRENGEERGAEKNVTVDISVVATGKEALCLEEEEANQRHVEGIAAICECSEREGRIIGDASDVVLFAECDYGWRVREHNGAKCISFLEELQHYECVPHIHLNTLSMKRIVEM